MLPPASKLLLDLGFPSDEAPLTPNFLGIATSGLWVLINLSSLSRLAQWPRFVGDSWMSALLLELTSTLRSWETSPGPGGSHFAQETDRHTETLLQALFARRAGSDWQCTPCRTPEEVAGPLGGGRVGRLGVGVCPSTHLVYQLSLAPSGASPSPADLHPPTL